MCLRISVRFSHVITPFELRVVERREERGDESERTDEVAMAEQCGVECVCTWRCGVHEEVARVAAAPLRVNAGAAEQLAAHVVLLAASPACVLAVHRTLRSPAFRRIDSYECKVCTDMLSMPQQ